MESSDRVGAEIHDLIRNLFPICRSITGEGVRQSLRRLQQLIPLEVHEVPSGTSVLDWTIPNEWNIRDAWIKDGTGTKVVDFQRSNLHVVSYSQPVRVRMSLRDLRPHLFTIPEHPEWIPYRTSYYRETWGFCLSQNQLHQMPEGTYDVCIDSRLEPGHLTYGELFLPGECVDEFLISRTSAIPRSATTTCRASASPLTSHGTCWTRPSGGVLTGSSSSREPLAPSRGWPRTSTGWIGSEAG